MLREVYATMMMMIMTWNRIKIHLALSFTHIFESVVQTRLFERIFEFKDDLELNYFLK